MNSEEIERQNVITEMKRLLVNKYLEMGFTMDESYLKTSNDLYRIDEDKNRIGKKLIRSHKRI